MRETLEGKLKSIGIGISMLLAGLTLGLLLSLGWQQASNAEVDATAPETSKIELSITRLEAEQAELKGRLASLRQELATRQEAAISNTDQMQALRTELARQQLIAGLKPVQGPGVLITLDDSTVQFPRGADANAFIIHEYDLRDTVNLLWMAGSEAIAINGERLVSQSSVYCVGSTVMVNNTRLSPPYLIRAIGNPRVQQDYLRNPSYLQNLKQKQRLYGLRFDVEASSNLTLPAYAGGFLIQHAKPGD